VIIVKGRMGDAVKFDPIGIALAFAIESDAIALL
jgi:hypothetical protein